MEISIPGLDSLKVPMIRRADGLSDGIKAGGIFDASAPLVLSMEVTPMGDEDEEIVLASTKRVLNRAWALVED